MDISTNPYQADFPLFAERPGLVYLDSAATAQRPRCVIETQSRFYEHLNANALRGLYALSVEATQAVEQARHTVAEFVGTHDDGEIIFTRNTSESLNLAAQTLAARLEPGDEVCISIMEHHSNLIPWQQICKARGAKLVYLYLDQDFCISPEELTQKINSRTKIVSVAHVSNVLGTTQDIASIARRAHEVGALMIVDAAQSAPHLRLDVAQLGCDLLAFSAHKCLGPFGIGVLWGKRELLESLPPFLTGGEMIDSVTEQDAIWAPLPEKFEAGTQDAAGIVASAQALSYLQSIGFDELEAREAALTCYLTETLADLPFVDLIGPTDGNRRVGAVAFNVRGVHPHDVASILDSQNVCIRAGHHCAQPLLTWLDEKSTCRASVAFYNTAHDIDKLAQALTTVGSIFNV